jgi:acyl-CoA synthetase (AMP-forming)/AMP-acid ligase II
MDSRRYRAGEAGKPPRLNDCAWLPHAFVILKEGATITEVELVAWSKQNMADYKYPRIIEFRETLPMTATGKVLKSELRS